MVVTVTNKFCGNEIKQLLEIIISRTEGHDFIMRIRKMGKATISVMSVLSRGTILLPLNGFA
jgi:hypothetical protein